jgi:toxin ParE1/3/4
VNRKRSSVRPYRLSPLAETDLEDIWLYTFENWSLEQADRYQNDIMAAIAALARGTRTGRPVDIREGYFKYATGLHFVFYQQSDSSLDVFRVLHRRMNASAHL